MNRTLYRPTRRSSLDIANPSGVGQAGQRIAFRDKLVGDVSVKAGLGDRPHDGRIVQLLRVIDFIAVRIAAGVVMADVVLGRADRADDIKKITVAA